VTNSRKKRVPSQSWLASGTEVALRPYSLSLEIEMLTFVLWCILLVLCWPIALLALVLYPVVWLLLLPFRIVGIAVDGVLKLVWAIVTLPARLVSSPGRL
jgi:hypothetical protein